MKSAAAKPYGGWQRFVDRAVLWFFSLLIEGAVFLLTLTGRDRTAPK